MRGADGDQPFSSVKVRTSVAAGPRRSRTSFANHMSVSAMVRQQAHRFFAPAQADDVIAALDASDLSLGFTSVDRVQLAILLISRGDMQQFRAALRQATQDWRDTLVSAGLADEDWPAVLKQQGIDISK